MSVDTDSQIDCSVLTCWRDTRSKLSALDFAALDIYRLIIIGMLWQGRSCLEAKPSNITFLQQTLSLGRNNWSQNNNWRPEVAPGEEKSSPRQLKPARTCHVCSALLWGAQRGVSQHLSPVLCRGGEGGGGHNISGLPSLRLDFL